MPSRPCAAEPQAQHFGLFVLVRRLHGFADDEVRLEQHGALRAAVRVADGYVLDGEAEEAGKPDGLDLGRRGLQRAPNTSERTSMQKAACTAGRRPGFVLGPRAVCAVSCVMNPPPCGEVVGLLQGKIDHEVLSGRQAAVLRRVGRIRHGLGPGLPELGIAPRTEERPAPGETDREKPDERRVAAAIELGTPADVTRVGGHPPISKRARNR